MSETERNLSRIFDPRKYPKLAVGHLDCHELDMFNREMFGIPTFTLAAKDVTAASLVQQWIAMNAEHIGDQKRDWAEKAYDEFRVFTPKKRAD